MKDKHQYINHINEPKITIFEYMNELSNVKVLQLEGYAHKIATHQAINLDSPYNLVLIMTCTNTAGE